MSASRRRTRHRHQEEMEISYVILDDIVNSRVAGVMCWSCDHHIERGCEISLSCASDSSNAHPHPRMAQGCASPEKECTAIR